MIELTTGDILKDDSEAIVNTVNCVGIMGRGIALQFKNAWPENFKAYEVACKREEVQPGRMFVFDTEQLTSPRYIINFPTKRHWRGKSRMQDIDSGLTALVAEVQQRGIRSIAIPPLGSGLGGLEWTDVLPRIEQAMQSLPEVRVRIYEPKGAPQADKMHHSREVPNMTAGRAALVELMSRYMRGLLDPTISLLEVHKLMYFMQEAGEPLRLKYVRAPYGPYAENLRHVLKAIEGHMVAGYADGGDDPTKPLSLVPGIAGEAEAFLTSHQPTKERFDRVGALVDGFETPFGLELLSTVHWVASNDESATTEGDVVARVHAWNERKKQFTLRHIGIALNVLADQGWIDAERMAEHA
jgi:O-acetyl-ADP-ribose deacetylase (regulator of RNase III)